MDGKNNKEGSPLERLKNIMGVAQNVSPISKHIKLDEKADRPNFAWWKRLGVGLGFMKHEDEPHVNGTALLFAILFSLAVIYIYMDGAVNFALMVDEKRAEQMIDKTAGKRLEDKLNREREKRAQLLDIYKQKGIYTELPESLKVFESYEADKFESREKR